MPKNTSLREQASADFGETAGNRSDRAAVSKPECLRDRCRRHDHNNGFRQRLSPPLTWILAGGRRSVPDRSESDSQSTMTRWLPAQLGRGRISARPDFRTAGPEWLRIPMIVRRLGRRVPWNDESGAGFLMLPPAQNDEMSRPPYYREGGRGVALSTGSPRRRSRRRRSSAASNARSPPCRSRGRCRTACRRRTAARSA